MSRYLGRFSGTKLHDRSRTRIDHHSSHKCADWHQGATTVAVYSLHTGARTKGADSAKQNLNCCGQIYILQSN